MSMSMRQGGEEDGCASGGDVAASNRRDGALRELASRSPGPAGTDNSGCWLLAVSDQRRVDDACRPSGHVAVSRSSGHFSWLSLVVTSSWTVLGHFKLRLMDVVISHDYLLWSFRRGQFVVISSGDWGTWSSSRGRGHLVWT